MQTDDRQQLEAWAADIRWDKPQYIACMALDPEGETLDVIRQHTHLPILTLDPGGETPNPPGVEGFSDPNDLLGAVRMRAIEHQSAEVLVTGWAQDTYPDLEPEFISAIQAAHEQAESERVTRIGNVHDWTRLTLQTLPRAVGRPVVNRMMGSLKDLPVIIVGAGPSLDKNIATVAALQKRQACAILAVNTAVPALAAAGCKPDMVFVAESKPRVLKDFAGLDMTETTLVAGIHTPLELDEIDFASRWLCVTASAGIGTWVQHILSTPNISNGGSVSTVALAAAIHLGCDPIVMVGMDCAHGEGGTHHAEGTDRGDYPATVRKAENYDCELEYQNESGRWLPAREVTGWAGFGKVTAPACLNSYRQWFEFAAKPARLARLLANCTEGGAHIEGFEELMLDDFAWVWPEGPTPAQRIRAAECTAPPLSREELSRGLQQLDALSAKAAKAARKAARLAQSTSVAERQFQAALEKVPLAAAWAQLVIHAQNQTTAGGKPLDRIAAAIGVAGESIESDVGPLVRASLREVDNGNC